MKIRKTPSYILLICSFYFFIPLTNASEVGIQVVGVAKVDVIPDMATFSFSIGERGKILSQLKGSVDAKSSGLVSLCKELGIESKNIFSSQISIRPQYNFKTKTLIVYEVSRDIKVTLNVLAKYSELVNGAIDAGVTTIRSIDLDIKDRTVLENKALGSAIKMAKKKAEIVASNTGTKLGRVLSVKEGGNPIEMDTYRFRELSQSSPAAMRQGAFEPGEISVSASVVIMYEIK